MDNLNSTLLLVALGFSFLDIFGGMFNDYYDYKLDVKNKRQDKWISAGLVTRNQMLYLSILFGFFGLLALSFSNVPLFLVGFYYFLMMVGYSYPGNSLGRNFATYFLLSAIYLPMFYFLTVLVKTAFTKIDIYYTLFAFFQATYLIAHKDVNDTKDGTNLFLKRYGRGFLVCVISGILSSAFLLLTSVASASLFVLWLLNLTLKIWLLKRIHEKTVERTFRDRIVLFEFLTPYIYAAAILI